MSRIKNPPKEQNDVLFGEIIQKAIKNKKISQATLGDMLGVSRNTVTNWVADRYKPEHDIIVRLSEILGITLNELYGVADADEFSRAERAIINNYRMLSDTSKRAVSKIVADILDEELAAEDAYLKENFMLLEHPKTKAAAGQGYDFIEMPSDHIFIRRNEYNCRADAVIEVSGDSMLPVYKDGDYVYVEYTDCAYPGQDVVCSTANGGIIKRLTSDYKLESVNPELPFSEKGEGDSIRIIGRVLGVVTSTDRPTERELISLQELFADELQKFEEEDG